MKKLFKMLDEIYLLECKAERDQLSQILTHVDRLKRIMAEYVKEGGELYYHIPLGEPYDDTMSDKQASIAGESHENLEIIEVIKPTILLRRGELVHTVRPALVIVKSRDELTEEAV